MFNDDAKAAMLSVVRIFRKPFDYICHDDGTDAPIRERIARFCTWFASGTDCLCCIGMRVPVAFVIGVMVGVLLCG